MTHLLDSPLTLLIAQLVTIITAARLLGLLARRIHQPLVIAEVVAGIVLGPSLLGAVAPGVKEALFPASSLAVLGMLSQLGLILFMFLVGLELDLRMLRGRGKAAVLISHTSIVVPFALGALLALYIFPILGEPGVDFTSFTLFMGAAMSITAFPVLARILTERRLLRTRVGAMTITCAAVDDVTAWCILAFVVSIARATAVTDAVWTTVLAVGYTLLMLRGVRPFVARLAARGSDREGLTQNAVALTFVLLFVSSWATELIGIHALFGAFLMGAIVPREGGFARALAEKLEDLVVIVLLPTFFALSGLRTQIGLLNTPETWLQCGLIILVACAGKFGGSFAAARWTGLAWRESAALGVLMNTRGLMELIVLNIGLELGVITPTLFTMMVLMALFTTFITTPILQVVYPPAALARDLLEPPAEAAPPAAAAAGFRALMCVAYDRSGPGMAQVARALVGADAREDRLYALQLLRPAMRTSTMLEEEEAPAPANAMAPLLERGQKLGLEVRPISFVSSEPARDICGVAEVKDVDLVLLGWHKPLLGQTILGGVVHEVLKAARADVGVLIGRDLEEIRAVLVGFAGSPHDLAGLRLARRMAEAGGVTVTVLHVRREGPLDPALAAALREAAGDRVTIREVAAAHDDPTAPVLAAAAGHDLVILGTSPEWGLTPRVLSLTAEHVLHRCPASVLVVHHGGRPAGELRPPRPRTEPPGVNALSAGV